MHPSDSPLKKLRRYFKRARLRRQVIATGLFDRDWYLAENADVRRCGLDPVFHYVVWGEAQGIRPNRWFDPVWYADRYMKNGKAGKGRALRHYARHWRSSSKDPCAEFSASCYRTLNATMIGKDEDPLAHYLAKGSTAGAIVLGQAFSGSYGAAKLEDYLAIRTSGLFDSDWYTRRNADATTVDPVAHYVEKGVPAGRWPNRYFDTAWYLQTYRLEIGGRNPFAHFIREGAAKGNAPSRRFSPSLYLNHRPEAVESGLAPLSHFMRNGAVANAALYCPALTEGASDQVRRDYELLLASDLFDAEWYLERYPDAVWAKIDPLVQYLLHGSNEGRRPNPHFDSRWYKALHASEIGDENPLAHYIREGAAKGYRPSRIFDPGLYRAKNPDIGAAEPLAHYLTIGIHEGRAFPTAADHMQGSGATDPSAQLPGLEPMRDMVRYPVRPLAEPEGAFNPMALDIHWVVPDFAIGGGGHMTIFRMTHLLELMGHRVTIWVNNPSKHKTPAEAYETIVKHFQHFAGEVRFIDGSFAEARGDALIATDCWSVWPVMSATHFKQRFYFVQDFEPAFHPMGARYLAAEETYRQDLYCICASPWLAGLMGERYGRKASHFWLAADRSVYYPPAARTQNKVPRIAVYARHFTARRAVEFAMLALEELARRGIAFEVDFFGADLQLDAAPFVFRDHGVTTPEALADLFRTSDIGLVFSATNYSLVPQEMMACGLPLVELDVESTRAIFPVETVSFAAPHPASIADALERLIDDPAARTQQAAAAMRWVEHFSWENAAREVEQAICAGLWERTNGVAVQPPATMMPMKASVVIPTLNPGPDFEKVLKAVLEQQAPWRFEILVIDSGSKDDTLNIVRKYPTVKLHQINKQDFNHGDTRNLGAELTSGEFIAYLTHDALPASTRWLFNLVTALEHYPDAAGVFGKHLAWPDATPFTKRDMKAHFTGFDRLPLALDKATDANRYAAEDPSWRQKLHFYSDNNSCFRRTIWEKIPYPRTKFGEDQLWAEAIIKAGYAKVYAPQAVVYHSHDFNEADTEERHFIESAFFKHFFGYELMRSPEQLEQAIAGFDKADTAWAAANDVPEAALEHQRKITRARLEGMLRGTLADTSEMF
ncbi:rhamnosyltransferase WsaF family glycosyltransferase [Gimibacter soli]|uniref:Glycosyltransferase n=1 Tax=Gimibacter soli TaxID=3024400 RepID=A0AAF0BM69_9PROT|nr:glycosyltransferase [Gimibacter soli]WCL55127.1 glycosyltransferase [Gimibacter soli]